MTTEERVARLAPVLGAHPDMNDTVCEAVYEVLNLPEPIRRHSRAVAEKAEALCAALPDFEDRALVKPAALLHDIARQDKHHPRAAAEVLQAFGYPELAAVVEVHHDMPEELQTKVCAATVLYYADKLMQEDREVTLSERFAASEAKCTTPEAGAAHEARRQQAFKIENTLLQAMKH